MRNLLVILFFLILSPFLKAQDHYGINPFVENCIDRGLIKKYHRLIDTNKINRELGCKPSVTFEQGLEKTIDWYLSNEEWLKNVTSGEYAKYYEKQYN